MILKIYSCQFRLFFFVSEMFSRHCKSSSVHHHGIHSAKQQTRYQYIPYRCRSTTTPLWWCVHSGLISAFMVTRHVMMRATRAPPKPPRPQNRHLPPHIQRRGTQKLPKRGAASYYFQVCHDMDKKYIFICSAFKIYVKYGARPMHRV